MRLLASDHEASRRRYEGGWPDDAELAVGLIDLESGYGVVVVARGMKPATVGRDAEEAHVFQALVYMLHERKAAGGGIDREHGEALVGGAIGGVEEFTRRMEGELGAPFLAGEIGG